MNQVQTTTKQVSPLDALKQNIMAMTTQFQAALPKHVSVDKFCRVIMTAANTSPSLISADRSSFFNACLKAASDGLLPDGKEAALVPYKVQGVAVVNYMPMLAGLLKKARNSGQISMIDAKLVYEKDQFEYYINESGIHFNHKPADPFGDAGNVRGVYAIATLKDGSTYFEPLSIKDIEAIKSSSRSKDSGPWSGKFEFEMWKKSALRRLLKRLPMSTDVEKVIESDNDDFEFQDTPQISAPIQPMQIEAQATPVKPLQDKTKPSKLSKIISSDDREVVNEQKTEQSEEQTAEDII